MQQISDAFKHSHVFQEVIRRDNGIIKDPNGETYDLKKDEDLVKYINREIENKEKTYDNENDTNQLSYNRRQIKYLFSSLIEKKFENQMKPEFERIMEMENIFKTSIKMDLEQRKELKKKQKNLDLFDPVQVLDYYKQIKNHKASLAMEESLKNKIVDFAKGLEMDKNKNYDAIRQKFNLSYNFNHTDEIKHDDEHTIRKKQIAKFLQQQDFKFDVIDHSDQYNRGSKFNISKNYCTNDDKLFVKEKTTFNQNKDVDQYYLDKANYNDDLPYDLYNMVSFSKRIDYKNKIDLDIRDVTKDIIKNKYEEQTVPETIADLAQKHLEKEVFIEDDNIYIQTVLDREEDIQKQRQHQSQIGRVHS